MTTTRPSRRDLFRLGAGAVTAGVLAGCSSGGGSASGRLHILIDTSPAGKPLEKAIEKYNQGNPTVRATYDSVPFDALQQKTLLNFASGANQYDVIQAASGIATVANYLAPMDDMLRRDDLAVGTLFGKTKGYQWHGRTIGLPYRDTTNILSYRRDLLHDEGIAVPTTIDDWVDAAIKLHQMKKVRFGSSLISNDASFSRVVIAWAYLPYGLRIINTDRSGPDDSLTSDAAVHILEQLQRLTRSGAIPNPVSWSYSDEITAWQKGWIGLSNINPGWASGFNDKEGRIGYAMAPGQPATPRRLAELGPYDPVYADAPWYVSINAKSPDKANAWRFVKFAATSVTGQEAMAFEGGNLPTLLSVLESKRYQTANPAAEPQLKVFKSVGSADSLPVQKVAKVEEAIRVVMQRLYQGDNPRSVARAMFDGIAKAMKGS